MELIGCARFFFVLLTNMASEITWFAITNFLSLDGCHRGDLYPCSCQEKFIRGK